MMMNSEPVLKQAAALADRLAGSTPLDFPAPAAGGLSRPRAGQWQFGAGRYDCVERPGRTLSAADRLERLGLHGRRARRPIRPLAYVSLNRQGGSPSDLAAFGHPPLDGAGRRPTVDRRAAEPLRPRMATASQASIVSQPRAAWPASGRPATATVPTRRPAPIDVKQGDTIDFVVDCRESTDGRCVRVDRRTATGRRRRRAELGHWNSAADFAGPTTPSLAAQVAYAWQLAFRRPITAEEFSLVDAVSRRSGSTTCAARFDADPVRQAMADLAQQLFSANEFLYVD